jgi:hypothetical protein
MLTISVAMRCSACALATLLMVPVLPAERILRQDLNGSMLAEQALEGRRIDWKSIVKEMKPVFRNNKRDEFIVYETDGKGLTLLSKPNPNCMCWNTFKEAMKACGPRGTMCIGMYNFNFPIKTGSSTLKGKIGLFLAQDPKEMQKTIGSPIGVMRVQLPTINDVWQPLQKQLSAASMHPSMKSEMGSAEEIDSHGPEWIWGEFARKATRNDQATVDSFLDDLTAKNERVGARGCNVLEERDDGAAPVHAMMSHRRSELSVIGTIEKSESRSGDSEGEEEEVVQAGDADDDDDDDDGESIQEFANVTDYQPDNEDRKAEAEYAKKRPKKSVPRSRRNDCSTGCLVMPEKNSTTTIRVKCMLKCGVGLECLGPAALCMDLCKPKGGKCVPSKSNEHHKKCKSKCQINDDVCGGPDPFCKSNCRWHSGGFCVHK